MYKNERGVGQDDKTAVKWFRLAAEKGDANAHYDLGLIYAMGRGALRIISMPICGEILLPLMGTKMEASCEI